MNNIIMGSYFDEEEFLELAKNTNPKTVRIVFGTILSFLGLFYLYNN
jgi:hypothetical protein